MPFSRALPCIGDRRQKVLKLIQFDWIVSLERFETRQGDLLRYEMIGKAFRMKTRRSPTSRENDIAFHTRVSAKMDLVC